MQLKVWLTYSILLLGLTTACTNQDIYYSNSVPIDIWESENYVHFKEIPAVDDAELIIAVNHDADYGYENLYVNTVIVAEGDTVSNEVFSIDFMSDDGVWAGKRQGDSYKVEHAFDEYKSWSSTPVHLYIGQYSREANLKGISEISVKLRARKEH